MGGVGPDVTDIEVSPHGGKHSQSGYRFDLIDAPAMLVLAGILHQGCAKYGDDNWRGISVKAHLNHVIMHAMAYLAGDAQDDHLGHLLCRAMMALATALRGGPSRAAMTGADMIEARDVQAMFYHRLAEQVRPAIAAVIPTERPSDSDLRGVQRG